MDRPDGSNGFISEGNHREKQCGDGSREIFESALLLALKTQKGAVRQRMQKDSRSLKTQGNRFFPGVSRRNKLC